ncbi:MAG: hypothetical protein ACOC0N_10830 [Chroococcales cyanobacterium]
MRYLSLLVLSSCFLLQSASMAVARDTKPKEIQDAIAQIPISNDFWVQAQPLVQQQLYLLENIEEAIASPDINRVETVRGKVFLYLGQLDRFLRSQSPSPQLLCENRGSVSNLSVEQQQVYCTLYTTYQQLQPIDELLKERLPILAELQYVDPLPPEDSAPDALLYNFRDPVIPYFAPIPKIPNPEPPVLTQPQKTPISGYQQPLQPAIAPLQSGLLALEATRPLLLSILPLFPEGTRFYNSDRYAEESDRYNYAVRPNDIAVYADFLAQPNTGITRILPSEVYQPDLTKLRNRLEPTISERFPYSPLPEPENNFIPRLTLQVQDDILTIPMESLNYGFMVELGDIPLNEVSYTRPIPNLSQAQQGFFLQYRPPQQLENITADQRRFFFGKAGLGEIPPLAPPVFPAARANIDSTYLMRLIQYQLPEAVVTGEPIPRYKRRNLNDILEVPSSDLLIAFRPVRRHSNGSYTILWKVIGEFEDPEITDLIEYVYLE